MKALTWLNELKSMNWPEWIETKKLTWMKGNDWSGRSDMKALTWMKANEKNEGGQYIYCPTPWFTFDLTGDK